MFCLTGVVDAAAAPALERVAPPPGITIAVDTRAELEREATHVAREIEFLDFRLRDQPHLHTLLPDVRIYHKAVDWALRYEEFLRSNDVAIARQLLGEASRRCAQLREGHAPWTTATGLVVRGYVSRVDGSLQPYGLVVPASWAGGARTGALARSSSTNRKGERLRLDVWLHGRDDFLTELKFIADRQRSVGEFAPPDAFVLHPYGRYCNAFKFAGEVDVFEAIAAVQNHYDIDPDRMAVRGFSMGGAGCWHLAAHHADVWAAANPGAGFVETAVYTGANRRVPQPPAFEQRLWHWYDATDYALNLFQCPTFAYSGEIDKQKQAADFMETAMRNAGLTLRHVIGPGTAHKYEPAAKQEIASLVDGAVAARRHNDADEVRFQTWTLRYPRMRWVTVEGLENHWNRATVLARRSASGFEVATKNVSRLSLARKPAPAFASDKLNVEIDGVRLSLKPENGTDRIYLVKEGKRWTGTRLRDDMALRKRPGLQGPIDDAFMDRFLFVRPTGPALSPELQRWVGTSLARATNEWRAQFRGEVPVKDDVDVTADDMANAHLILWGDPQSNSLLGKIKNRLPLEWTSRRLAFGNRGFSTVGTIPVLIYPNPLNPHRYVVLNSGFTFWRAGDASNAQQTPKLPDFAVLDLATPLGQLPGRGVIFAGFFNDNWGLPAD